MSGDLTWVWDVERGAADGDDKGAQVTKWGVKAALALTEGPVELPGAAWLRMIPGVELVVVDVP